jgi:hypothetical protein
MASFKSGRVQFSGNSVIMERVRRTGDASFPGVPTSRVIRALVLRGLELVEEERHVVANFREEQRAVAAYGPALVEVLQRHPGLVADLVKLDSAEIYAIGVTASTMAAAAAARKTAGQLTPFPRQSYSTK